MFDYENMTPEEIANLTDEEFSKLDPSKLPTFSEPTEDTQPEVTVEDTPEVAETLLIHHNQLLRKWRVKVQQMGSRA